jgi:hypothetical protein
MTAAASHPFEFCTVASLTRICNQKASTLAQLVTGLDQCSDASIFHHTFQTLGSHHFLTEGFSNDFAQWVLEGANRPQLAEQLAALDIRDYVSLAELRNDLRRLVAEYCIAYPLYAEQETLEDFHFCESTDFTMSLGMQAGTLEEFRAMLEKLSHSSFYFHFISSRLRLHLQTNDFSLWFAEMLGRERLASSANRIDIYTNTLDGARGKLLRLVDRELSRQ